MDEETKKLIRETIENAVKTTVNGKIDRLDKKMDAHNIRHEEDMKEVKVHIEKTTPIIEAYDGFITMGKSAKVIGDAIKWIAGVITAIGLLWVVAKNFILK